MAPRINKIATRIRTIIEWLRKIGLYAVVTFPKSETKPVTKPEARWDLVSSEERGDPVLGRQLLDRWSARR